MKTQLFRSVLLVEDDPAHAMLVQRALRGLVGEVQHAASLAEARAALGRREVELIITDLQLPDGHPGELIERTREAAGLRRGPPPSPPVPVVVLTASTSLQDAVDAMRCGARDFIVKDFSGQFEDVLALALERVHSTLRLEQERSRLLTEMQTLRIAIENSNDGLAVVDRAGAVLYANSSFLSFARRCGGDPGNVRALFSPQVAKHEVVASTLQRNLEQLTAGAVWHTEVTFVEDRERAFDLSLSAVQQPDEQGEVASNECVLWLRDITEQKRREKFQREILSTTTHDLKGPLGAIMISAELLTEMLKGNRKAEQLSLRISSAAHGVVNLIDEFLSARRIQEGTLILRPVELSVRKVSEEVIDGFRPMATARAISLTSELPPEELTVLIDRHGFIRVLSNLLSNALKFTPKEGSVSVSVEVRGEDLHLVVSDTGSGMEPSDVSKLFERFGRLERHSDVAGTGLGLFVVRSVVTAHGGRIEVTSQVGKGTTFDIAFPLKPPVNQRGELICLDFA